MKILFAICFILSVTLTNSQSIAINTDGSAPDNSSLLDVKSSIKGVLFPRMNSSQRGAIIAPATGLLVFDTGTNSFWFYSGISWIEIRGVGSSNFWLPHSNGIYYNAGKIGVGIIPHSIVPLSVWQPNTGNGNAILHLRSNDIYHSALSMFNGNVGAEKEYSFILAGPSNVNLQPGGFGLLNHQTLTWSFNFNQSNNYMAIGSPSFNANVAKSRLHVFNGDINIDQIGTGIILKSPNGNCWRITIDDAGNLIRSPIVCP